MNKTKFAGLMKRDIPGLTLELLPQPLISPDLTVVETMRQTLTHYRLKLRF